MLTLKPEETLYEVSRNTGDGWPDVLGIFDTPEKAEKFKSDLEKLNQASYTIRAYKE